MIKYIAVKHHDGRIEMLPADRVYYTPAGWGKGGNKQYLDLAHGCRLTKPVYCPPKKGPAAISGATWCTRADNARVVSDEVSKAIDDIDERIAALRRMKLNLVTEDFMTFRLVQDGDVQRSHAEVFPTMREAKQAEGK